MLKKSKINKESIFVALGFFTLSFLWILFSDRVLLYFLQDVNTLTRLQTFKGWFYVLLATIFIYYLVNREIIKKNKLIYLLNEKSAWQRLLLKNIPNIEVILFDQSPEPIFIQGERLLEKISGPNDISLEQVINFENDKQRISYATLKTDILEGNNVNLKFKKDARNLLIKGRAIKNDHDKIIAGLLVFIDDSEHVKIVDELNGEKEKYNALFNEYHSINLELNRSYQELTNKNIDLLASQERYQNFLNQTSDAIFRVDFESPINLNISLEDQKKQIIDRAFIAECNPVFAQIYNKSVVEEITTMKYSDFLDNELMPVYINLIDHLVQNNYRLKDYGSVELLGDNKEHHYLNTMVGIVENRKLLRIWGTKTDITILKQVEKELINAKQKAEESDKLKTAFLANMSHEIRTPLNGIIGFAELLSIATGSEQRERYVSIIKNNNTRLLRIIDDILDISRIETGQILLTEQVFNINKLMSDVKEHLDNELGNKRNDIRIVVRCGLENGEDQILADDQRIFQVLSNLVDNAVKFTEKGEISIGYETNNEEIQFYVSDTGIGIPVDMHKKIFNQFAQVEECLTRKYGGTGLGLSICRGIAELLGGEINLESELEKGSKFWFKIPYKKANT